MPLERKLSLGLSGLFLAGALSCGAEGASAKGCKNDNDCKGDRYCDESTNQCVSEGTVEPNPLDVIQSPQLKTILDEDFNGSGLKYSWQAGSCETGCPSPVRGEDYSLNNGVLVLTGGFFRSVDNVKLGDGKIVLEYSVKSSPGDYIIHGLRNYAGNTRLMCYGGDDDGAVFGCGVSEGGGDNHSYSKDKNFSLDPYQWHTIKVEADASQATFTVDNSQTATFSTQELNPSSKLEVWLYGGSMIT